MQTGPITGAEVGAGGVGAGGEVVANGGVAAATGGYVGSTGGGGTTAAGGTPGSGGVVAGNGGAPVTGGAPGTGGDNGEIGPGDVYTPEQCFKLLAHGAQVKGDTSKFSVRPGEFYHNFSFQAPYDKAMKGLSFKPIIDNAKIIHHWLLFQVINGTRVDMGGSDGIGTHPDSQLVTGWAPGGDPPDMPPGVGMQIPAPGGYYEIEIHYFNNTGDVGMDASGVDICVTSQPTKETATLTWLGTEQIFNPANAQATASGTCTPQNPKKGDIHIIATVPHMHVSGTHMKTVINHAGGDPEVLLDKPFVFLDQRTYVTPTLVHPGDTLTTTCTYQNTTSSTVLFGPSTTQEMCYNFVLAYPADALSHPGLSLEGSQNTCLF
jgi:hypothetical protein